MAQAVLRPSRSCMTLRYTQLHDYHNDFTPHIDFLNSLRSLINLWLPGTTHLGFQPPWRAATETSDWFLMRSSINLFSRVFKFCICIPYACKRTLNIQIMLVFSNKIPAHTRIFFRHYNFIFDMTKIWSFEISQEKYLSQNSYPFL